MAIVRDVFEGKDAAKTFSLLAVVGGLAPMLAPSLGGILLLWTGWKGIFWTLAAVGILCLIGMHFRLPETAPDKRLSVAPRQVFRAYWSIFRDRTFLLFTVGMGFSGAGMFAYIAGSPFVFMQIYGLTPWQYGLVFGGNVLSMVAAAQINVLLMRRFDPLRVLRASAIVQLIAGLLLVVAGAFRLGGMIGLLVPLILYLFCSGLIRPNATALAMTPFKHCAGTASALMGSMQFVMAAGAIMAIGMIHIPSALPMTGTIAVCGVASWLVIRHAVKAGANIDQQEAKAEEAELEPPVIVD